MMSPLRTATTGATTPLFSSPIGSPKLPIGVGAAASTIFRLRFNGAYGRTRHGARRPIVTQGSRAGSISALTESGRDCPIRASFLPEHIHHPLHRRMAAVLHLHPVLRSAGLIVWSRHFQCLPF